MFGEPETVAIWADECCWKMISVTHQGGIVMACRGASGMWSILKTNAHTLIWLPSMAELLTN